MRERRPGKGASLGKEAVLTGSGRAGEVTDGVGRGEKSDCFNILREHMQP